MTPNRFIVQRQQVIDACLHLSWAGYLAGTGGNVALRLDEQHFAVTPSATDYFTLTPADIAILRLGDLTQVDGTKPPSVESALHAAVLRARPEAQASVHTHQPLASAVAVLGVDLPVAPDAIALFGGPTIPAVPYAPSGTGLLVNALRRRLASGRTAYLLRNHGLVACAVSLAEAVALVGRIEETAASFLRTAAAGRAPSPLRDMALAALEPRRAS